MKNLTANKIAALAACAASTAAVSAERPTTRSTTIRGIPWVVRSIPRGGDDGSSSKSKKSSSPSSSSKKKKSTKKREDGKGQEKDSSNGDAPANPLLEEILAHNDFYDVLGVSKSATEREIQKAYRKRCVQTHPDKTGGDRRAFDKVAEAYDCLSDSSKRQIYNRFGKEGLDPTNAASGAAGFGGSGAADMFRNMFQQAQQQRQQQQRRNQTLRYQLEVTLEDLYHGRTQSVTVAPPYSRHHSYHRQRRKEVEVHIEKGSVSGQSIVMSGEVDFNDDNSPPGDLVFILTQAPHATFTRKGHDLAMELTITLEEALCGLRKSIRHLDGSEIWIESAAHQSNDDRNKTSKPSKNKDVDDEIHDVEDDEDSSASGFPASIPITIQTGDVQVLKGRGMPKRNRNGEFGDLYIQYRVEMPQNSKQRNDAAASDSLTREEYKELARLLSKLDDNNSSRSIGTSRRQRHRNQKENRTEEVQGHLPPPEVHSLKQAKSSDFGVASGKVEWDEEEGPGGFHEDQGDDYHPFASSFFGGQGFGGGRTYSQSFQFGGGGNPFGGYGGAPGDDDGNVQCQQM